MWEWPAWRQHLGSELDEVAKGVSIDGEEEGLCQARVQRGGGASPGDREGAGGEVGGERRCHRLCHG